MPVLSGASSRAAGSAASPDVGGEADWPGRKTKGEPFPAEPPVPRGNPFPAEPPVSLGRNAAPFPAEPPVPLERSPQARENRPLPGLARLEAGVGEGEASLRQPHIGGTTKDASKERKMAMIVAKLFSGWAGGECGTRMMVCRRGGSFSLPFAMIRTLRLGSPIAPPASLVACAAPKATHWRQHALRCLLQCGCWELCPFRQPREPVRNCVALCRQMAR